MRVLLVKTSSMGDIIHTLPALSDAGKALPSIQFDWVVEDVFADIPKWHPLVSQVVPVALRRWRREIFTKNTRAEWKQLRTQLSEQRYDLILDAQGLVKSALLTFFARGTRSGLDWNSAREKFAALAYQRTHTVNFHQHAIVRMRQLFSQALGYALPNDKPDFGINRPQFQETSLHGNYLVFLHGTTWATKLWPESYWVQLAHLAGKAGYGIKISGGSEEEMARAHRIASHTDKVEVIPQLTILEMAQLLANSQGVVAVDTGFGHLAAALNIPTISLYGPTNPILTGALGRFSQHLAANFPCAPCLSRTCSYKKPTTVAPACFETVQPNQVWAAWQKLMAVYKSEKGQFSP